MAATSSWAIRATCADGGFAARADRRAHRVGRIISMSAAARISRSSVIPPAACGVPEASGISAYRATVFHRTSLPACCDQPTQAISAVQTAGQGLRAEFWSSTGTGPGSAFPRSTALSCRSTSNSALFSRSPRTTRPNNQGELEQHLTSHPSPGESLAGDTGRPATRPSSRAAQDHVAPTSSTAQPRAGARDSLSSAVRRGAASATARAT